MSLKSIVRELREFKDGIGNKSKQAVERRHWRSRTRTHIAPENPPLFDSIRQGPWENLPPELLLDIIKRVEASETSWPARNVIVSCASVCRLWRKTTKEIVKNPEECGRLTFPISLKQPGPREYPIQCFVKRCKASSTYYLYIGLTPAESEKDKLLLAARKVRRASGTDFIISFNPDNFSKASNTYAGKLRSNFLGTKFTIYDSQPPYDANIQANRRLNRRFSFKQVSPRLPAYNYHIGSISYELNILRTRGPRRMHSVMNSIPVSSVQEGGTVPTPTSFLDSIDEHCSVLLGSGKDAVMDTSSVGLSDSLEIAPHLVEPLFLKNKPPRWHEQLQCWCLNFKGRVTVASVKNFQLVADVDHSHNVSATEQERVILQFGKIGKDIFTMDYCYPLSAFQAFAICLSSFDTKPVCE